MECGGDILCQLLDIGFSNTPAVLQVFETFDGYWNFAGEAILRFISEHGEKVLALASLTFAVWRWYRYREKVLHKRLAEYLVESDRRLGPSSASVVDTLVRPGRTIALPSPSFALEMQEVLANAGWKPRIFPRKNLKNQLADIMRGISQRQTTLAAAQQSLERQKMHTHMINGASLSAETWKKLPTNGDADRLALAEFLSALDIAKKLADKETLIAATESKAYQQWRLRDLDLAERAFNELEIAAKRFFTGRTRDLHIAKSKRYRAQILQIRNDQTGCLNAWAAIRSDNDSAISLLSRHSTTLTGWELIEYGDTCLAAANIGRNLNFTVQVPNLITRAAQSYERVAAENRKPFWQFSQPNKALIKAANDGMKRARSANEGDYDHKWFGYPSDDLEKPTAPVGDSTGNERIERRRE